MSISTLTHGRVTWTNIVHPTPGDIQQLVARYPQFHPLNLQDCLTELEIPKLDQHDDYLFLVTQMPIWDSKENICHPAEVDIFISSGTIVTSHRDELEPLRDLFAQAQADEHYRAELMEHGASPLLYKVLDSLVNHGFPMVKHINHHLRRIEDILFSHDTHLVLNDLASVRRDIITMRHILKPQREVIRELEQGSWHFIHDDLDLYWGDISDHLAQLCAILDEDSEMISGLSDTVDTLASHRVNEVVKLLTVVTIITLPLTLLATIFGMNIVMPFADHPLLFFTIVGLGIVLTGTLIWYLRKHRWW